MANRRRSARRLLIAVAVILGAGCSATTHRATTTPPASAPPLPLSKPRLLDFEATAYSVTGLTKGGTRTRQGIVAADPAVLPLGSRIRVHDAGSYSGEYTVEDSGRTIDGREIDIYVRSTAEAARFGRRRVKIEVLRRGSGTVPDSPTAAGR